MAGLCCCEYLIFIVNVYYITLYIYCTSLYVYKCIKIDTVQLFFIIIDTKNIIDFSSLTRYIYIYLNDI